MDEQSGIIVPAQSDEHHEHGVSRKHPHSHALLLFLPIWVVLIGISAYFFFNRKNVVVESVPQNPVAIVPTTNPNTLFLSLINTKGNITAVDGELLVSGRTLPYASVVIFSDIDETSVDSDGQGQFEGTVHVSEDGDVVVVTVFSESGEEKTETLAVSPTNETTKVLGKTDSNSPKPTRAIAARKTDFVSSNQLTVRSSSDVTTKEAKDFLQNRPFDPTERKLGALRMKEILASEGSGSAIRGNRKLVQMNVREATAGAASNRHAVVGVVTAVANGVITLAHQVQRDRVTTVLYNANTIFSISDVLSPTAANIVVGMRITAVGTPSVEGLLAKHIHVVSGKATGLLNKLSVTPSTTPSATLTPTDILFPSRSPTPTL